MKRFFLCVLCFMMMLGIVACAASSTAKQTDEIAETGNNAESTAGVPAENEVHADASYMDTEQEEFEMSSLKIMMGDRELPVVWEQNESVTALRELVSGEPLTVELSMYGGFEQVGSLGSSLPRNDVQISTSAGDIVLYSGNQIVLFYGSNTWDYTKLGRIDGMDLEALTEMLGNGDVTITISAGNE